MTAHRSRPDTMSDTRQIAFEHISMHLCVRMSDAFTHHAYSSFMSEWQELRIALGPVGSVANDSRVCVM